MDNKTTETPTSEGAGSSDDLKLTSEPMTPITSPKPGGGMKKKLMWILLVVVVLAGGVIGYMAMQKDEKPVAKSVPPRAVKVGVLDPVSGIWTNVGTSIKQGIEFATKEHAIDGLDITYIYKDTNCEAAKAEKATEELIAEGVIAIIGDLCSGSTLAAVPLAAEAKIPVVSATSTNPALTNAGPYFSRTIPSDSFASEFTADLLYKKTKITKLAIIHSDDTYGVGLNDAVSAAFKALGGTVVATESFKNEATDLAGQVARIQAAKPEALYLVTSSSVSWVALMQKMKDVGLSIPVYSAESLKDLTFIKDAGALAEGLYIIAVSEGSDAYIEKYQGAYATDPGLYSAQAYDAARVVVEALNTGAAAGEDMRAAIRKVTFDGASGTIKFDANGDVSPNFSVYKVVDGKFRVQD